MVCWQKNVPMHSASCFAGIIGACMPMHSESWFASLRSVPMHSASWFASIGSVPMHSASCFADKRNVPMHSASADAFSIMIPGPMQNCSRECSIVNHCLGFFCSPAPLPRLQHSVPVPGSQCVRDERQKKYAADASSAAINLRSACRHKIQLIPRIFSSPNYANVYLEFYHRD